MKNIIQAYNTKYLKTNLDESIHFYHFDEIDSTNNYARNCIDSNEIPALIISESQYKGRGTNQRSFFSPKRQGIYMSYVIDLEDQGLKEIITLVIANAVHSSLNSLGFPTDIKWINDLVSLNGTNVYKVAGILCEQYKSKIIVGIGINILMPEHEKDKYLETENQDINLNKDFTGLLNLYPQLQLERLREDIIISIIKNINLELSKSKEDILNYYSEHCLSMKYNLLIQNDLGNPDIAQPIKLHDNGNLEVTINNETKILSDNHASTKIIL